MEAIDYGDQILWTPITEIPHCLYKYIGPIGRPYTKINIYIYIYKRFCKTNLIAKRTN